MPTCSAFDSCFVIQYIAYVNFCNHLDVKERAGCFAITVFLAVSVLWFFLTVPWVGLQCVIVVFPYHTHLHFDKANHFQHL